MPSELERAVSHDGDIVKIDGKPVRMQYMVRDAFWADGRAVVLLDPDAFLDAPGGARKAPPDWPYITDWTCSSNGAWVNCIIESIFGVRAGLDGRIEAEPQFGPFDPEARLENLHYHGKRYHVTRKGIVAAD